MILPGIVAALFDNDTSPIRFEKFCLDLCREAEGLELVPTSLTWDLGRDGRGISPSGRELPVALCATLEADVDAKAEADIRRLAVTTKAKQVIYCSSRRLTEAKCDKIEARVRDIYPQLETVRVLGQVQLADLAERHEESLRRHYGAEIQNIETALLTPKASRQAEDVGLRLALMSQTGDDAWQLREQLATRLVLDTLLDTQGLPAAEIGQAITKFLHLPRQITAHYVQGLLVGLEREGLATLKGGVAMLTPAGVKAARDVPAGAGAKLLEGRAAVREAIRTLSGHVLTDSQFDKVWNTLQDGLANLFYSHGMAMVHMVRSLLAEEETPRRGGGPPTKLLDNLADKVAALFPESTQADEIRLAVVDMFSEKDRHAFKWLTEICSVYVMMCSLGFEALSNRQTLAALTSISLVPDTDVVLSLLCEGEDNHDEVERILTGWSAIGGKVLTAKPVLEEVSYHAWISGNDYAATEHQIAEMDATDARRLLGNSFVRAFKKVAGELTARKFWQQYIQQFRGDSEWDYNSIIDLLRDDYGFDHLSDAGEEYAEFAERVQQLLINRASVDVGCEAENLDYRTRDKCRRDGILLADVLAARQAARTRRQRGTTCVLSSARLLSEADQVFGEDLGQPDAVLSTASVSLLLTLIPQVAMGVTTLRCVLFDDLVVSRLSPAQRYAYRLIAASQQYEVAWSKRVTLHRELGRTIVAEAKARGEPVKVVREKVLRSEDPQYSAWVVARALDDIAATVKGREESYRLKAEIKQLKEEADALHEQLREAHAQPFAGKRVGPPPKKRRHPRR